MYANWTPVYAALALAVSLILLFLTGCEPTVQVRYITQELSRPERPLLPKVKARELECLSPVTYQTLYDRQRLMSEYAVTLETIIDATKSVPNDQNGAKDAHQPAK